MSKAPNIEPSWASHIGGEFEHPYFAELRSFLISEKQQHMVYPKGKYMFAAFDHTPFDAVKVVILGQDPYHGPGQAHGLCFSVPEGVPPPPSLVNIFKELEQDLGIQPPMHGNLTKWADQGVLLLNTTLTVRARQAGSHQGKGWERFTDAAITMLSMKRQGIVFLLWGSHAGKKATSVDQDMHYVLKAPHPSPLSAHRGFFGCGHFSKANKILQAQGKEPIDWSL